MSRIVKGIFGGSSQSEGILNRFRPAGFTSAGATGSFQNNIYSVTRTPERETALQGVVSGFRERASAIRSLRGDVTPGFGRLSQIRQEGTRARLNQLRADRARTIGTIREGAARRRLAGSSFAESEVSRAEALFSREADVISADANQREAEAFIQEIGLSEELISKEYDASVQGFQAVLNEMNFDTSIATQMSGQISALLADNLKAQAEARAAQQAAGESFIDNLLGAYLPTGS